ncbi:hypothetical protein PMAYCL1PPCAC_24830, partial [Pristionchus mayeri]
LDLESIEKRLGIRICNLLARWVDMIQHVNDFLDIDILNFHFFFVFFGMFSKEHIFEDGRIDSKNLFAGMYFLSFDQQCNIVKRFIRIGEINMNRASM